VWRQCALGNHLPGLADTADLGKGRAGSVLEDGHGDLGGEVAAKDSSGRQAWAIVSALHSTRHEVVGLGAEDEGLV
jgi:hypothetical protein